MLWGKQWRARSPENVIEELTLLKEKYRKQLIDILDDTFSLDKKRVIAICRLMKKEQVDLTWKCTTRVDLFDQETATAIKEAGCEHITFGIDSGVQRTLDFLHKGYRLEDSVLAVKYAKKAGLKVESNFIIGVPGETREIINQTIAFAKKLALDFTSFTLLTPYPGTLVYDYAEKNNLLRTKDWRQYTLIGSVMNVPGFTPRELQGLLLKSSLLFRLDPRIFYRSIAQKLVFARENS
jgi:radical SAM superfamily enzyme YgiQ (UPF0313 family)